MSFIHRDKFPVGHIFRTVYDNEQLEKQKRRDTKSSSENSNTYLSLSPLNKSIDSGVAKKKTLLGE
jgi:hypothetical protein